MPLSVPEERLLRQRITSAGLRTPSAVVAWFGAVQAQEYGPAKWGLAQRMAGSPRDARLEAAVTRGEIFRTHVLRPTWHFVIPADIRWMLRLTGSRVQRTMATYIRRHGVDAATRAKAIAIMERALEGRSLTRPELGAALARRGIVLTGTALALVAMDAELSGVICSGPYQGRHLTYASIHERAPQGQAALNDASRDEMVAELVRRFFRSHGPATTRDFAWWSGLTTADAKRGLEIVRGTPRLDDGLTYWTVGPRPAAVASRAARVHLLPIYDEFVVAYWDRVAVPHTSPDPRRLAPGVTFQHALIVDGQIGGTWLIARLTAGASARPIPLRPMTRAHQAALRIASARFESFAS